MAHERKHVSELEGEERYEAEAAFGEDATLIVLDTDELEPAGRDEDEPSAHDEADFHVEVGDKVVIRMMSGKLVEDVVVNVESYMFSTDGIRSTEHYEGENTGWFGSSYRFEDFDAEDTRGVHYELVEHVPADEHDYVLVEDDERHYGYTAVHEDET
jgi:hypothetical protein